VFGAGIQEGRTGEALLAIGRRRPVVVARAGDRLSKVGKILDLFSNPIDDQARAGVGPAGVAFQAALGGGGASSGIIVRSGAGLRAVALEGDDAPGGGSYRAFGTPSVGGGGVTFVATARGGESLFRAGGGAAAVIAATGRATDTRLHGSFRGFTAPAAERTAVAFHANLDQSREGIFVARGRCMMALAANGEDAPGGGRFKALAAPAYGGGRVTFRATVGGGAAAVGLYRTSPSRSCTQVPPTLEALVVAGAPSSAGPLLGFGAPAANRRGGVAFTADVTGAGPTDAIFVDE